MKKLKEYLELVIFESGDYTLQVFNLVKIAFVIILAWAVSWLIKSYLRRKRRQNRFDEGKRYALQQIFSYIIWVIAMLLVIDSAGIRVTNILLGSTALLVGLGLGLQDFFRDLVAGFIILSERTITAGDIVEIAGTVGQVKEVGLRTTSLITREDIILIVPNTRLTAENVVNWSQNNKVTRFRVDVGVAYGSDTALVEKILVECAKTHKDVMETPPPYVFFGNFGNSSLDFSLFFFSKNLFRIERVKSDLRFKIDKRFREEGVTIPFPQRDVWFKNLPEQKQTDKAPE
jgi:small-conductance mechanosensitive channel